MRWRSGAVARSTMLLVVTDDGVDPAYAACRRAGLEVARRAGAAVVLYDRSSESYLVDPYEPGPWTSQNHGPAGETLLNPNELVRLGAATSLIKSLRVARSGCRVGAWLAHGTGPAAIAAACERLRVERAILPSKMARPSLGDRILGRTLAAFQARVPAKITLVNDDGVLAEIALDQHFGDAPRWIATLRHFLADRWQTTIRAGVEDALCPGGAEGI